MRVGALVGAVIAAWTLGAGTATGAPSRPPGRVQVVEKEFSITLSRLRVHGGAVIVEVDNFGMDDHDLVVQQAGATTTSWRSPQLAPGHRVSKRLVLVPGRYTLYCSLPGHRALGMIATLEVVR